MTCMSQDEWLDRHDLIEDDWYSNPPATTGEDDRSLDGSGFEDGDLDDIHSEL